MLDKTLLFCLLFLAIVTIIQFVVIETQNTRLETYKTQIAQLHQDAKQAAQDTEAAHEIAVTQMRQIQDQTQHILKAKVSSNCDASIKWLIQQGHTS